MLLLAEFVFAACNCYLGLGIESIIIVHEL